MTTSTASIALWTYIVPMFHARAIRIVAIVVPILVALTLLGFYSGVLPDDTLENLMTVTVVPGVPLAAILLGEMPLRDGIRQRTLLYPLLGPTSRTMLAVVRTLATAIVLALGATALVLLLGILDGEPAKNLFRAIGAVFLGSLAYTAFFGVIHLITRRGLIAGLVIYGLFDALIAQVPLAMRRIAPSLHLRVIAHDVETYRLPVSIGGTYEPSVTASVLVLIGLTLVCLLLIALLFKRRNLGDLC